MAAIFFLMKEKQKKDAEIVLKKKRNDAAFAKDILKRFGKAQKGSLKFHEVKMWLETVAKSHGAYAETAHYEMESLLPGTANAMKALDPSVNTERSNERGGRTIQDEEVEWVIMMAMEKRQTGSFKKIVLDSGVNLKDVELMPSEFESALYVWLSYAMHQPALDAAMKKYGTNLQGRMERDSIKQMLTDMNGGVSPDEAEIDWMLKETTSMRPGGITKPQLLKVLSLWYARQQEKILAATEAAAAKKSKFCTIS